MMMMIMKYDDGDGDDDDDEHCVVKRYFRLVCEYEEDWMQISRVLSGGVSADVSVCTVYVMIITIHGYR